MSDSTRLLPSNGTPSSDGTTSSDSPSSSNTDSTSASSKPSSTWSLKNARAFLVTLLFFTLGFLFVFSFIQASSPTYWQNRIASSPIWNHFKTVGGKLAERTRLIIASADSATTNTTTAIATNPAASNGTRENNVHRDFKNPDEEVSEVLREFVRKKTGGRSTVAQYLASVRAYLRDFRSPVIRENPTVHSWPETDAEKEARRAKGLSSSTKQIMFFNAPSFFPRGPNIFQKCPVNDCKILWDYNKDKTREVDAVVYQGSPSSNVVTPRGRPHQVYVFFTMESPMYTGNGYKTKPWNSAFNWTWNFRLDSDIFEPIGYLRRTPTPPSLKDLLAVVRNKKKKVSWMSSNCNVPSKRDQYVARMVKVIPVDHFGKCGNLQCSPSNVACNTLLTDYFFYLSLENAMCDDYLTEKMYKTFKEGVHVVPVVRGGANYSQLFPEGTYVDAEAFKTPEDLGKHLLELIADEPRYLDMLWRKAHFLYLEHGLVDAFCQLCYKLHHLDRFAKTYSDLYSWYDRKQCRQPSGLR